VEISKNAAAAKHPPMHNAARINSAMSKLHHPLSF
jgi:hypothetical protein